MQSFAIGGKDSAGEGVGRSLVAEVQRLLVIFVVVDIDGDDRSEDFFAHRLVVGLLGEDNGRLNEPTHALVAGAAEYDFSVFALLGVLDIIHTVVERSLVDNSIDESRKVAHIADLDFLQHIADNLFDLRPHRLGDVSAACSRAFLALELEGAADDGRSHLSGVGAVVGEDEVLAAGFTDNLRIGAIVGNIVADALPEAVEGLGAAGEVHASQVLVGESHLADKGAAAGQEVDNAVGQACFLIDVHKDVVAQHSRCRGLPNAGVAHQDGRQAEVAGDRGEVERSDCKDEAFERAVGHIVERTLVAARLVAVYLAGIVCIVAQEVDQLASRVDFGLHSGFALSEHSGCIDEPTVFATDEGGDFQHHAGAFNPRGVGPLFVSLHSGVDSHLDLLLADLVVFGQHVVVLGGHHDGAGIFGFQLFAADNGADFKLLFVEFVESLADFSTFGTAWSITQYGFILGLGERKKCVVHKC